MMKLFVFLALVAFSAAYLVPIDHYPIDHELEPLNDEESIARLPEEATYETADVEADSYGIVRNRRSFQPGAPNFPMPGQPLPGSVGANVERQGPDTIATIKAQHKTDRHDVGATWSKVIRGPGKSKPNWSVGGSYKW